MITENRTFKEIVVKIIYTREVKGEKIKVEDKLKLQEEDTLEKAFIKYKRGKRINIHNVVYFYKSFGNEGKPPLRLSGKNKIFTLNLRENDKIIISDNDLSEIIYDLRKPNNDKKQITINYIILAIVIILFLIIIAVLLLLFLFKNSKKKGDEIKFSKEQLVTTIKYSPNLVYRYQSNKKMNMIVDINDTNGENFNKYITQYLDFFIIIRKENIEYDDEKHIQRKWFSGYIGILNLTVNNGTDDMILIYDKELYKYLNNLKNNNLRITEEDIDLSLVEENNNFCFIKIHFYENGGIKNIFLPKNFVISNMIYFNDIIKLIIPKISQELYINNITQKIEEFNQKSEEEDNDKEEEFGVEEMNDDNTINNSSFRDLSEEIETENFLLNQFSDSNKIDLREINSFESEISGNDSEVNSHFSNITEFYFEELEGEDAKLDNSEIKTYIYSILNEKGMLISIKEIQNIIMNQRNNSENNVIDEEDQYLKSQIYNEDNQITPDQSEPEGFIGQNFSVNFNGISMENINNIVLYDHFENDYFSKIIFKYFDNFQYTLYIQNDEFKNKSMRLLQNKEEISRGIKIKNDKLRSLLVDDSYYGNKNFETEKVLYKYNFLGLRLEGIIVCKVDSSTGVMSNYFQMIFGFINFKFKISKLQTNLHIITEKTNQMIYRFITLLYESNIDLIERNKMYGNIIVDIEKNTSQLFEEYFDYSGLFRDSLNDMYNQV